MRKHTPRIILGSLLLAFVVVSCATAPEAPAEEVPEEAVVETPEVEPAEEVEEVFEVVEEEGDLVQAQVEELLRQLDSFDNVSVTVTQDGVDIAITRAFGPNSTVIDSRLTQQLNLIGQVLELVQLDALLIEGHVADAGDPADDAPISNGRAENTATYLIGNYDVPAEVVTTVGRGAGDPIASNDTESGRSNNRRVVLLIRGSVS